MPTPLVLLSSKFVDLLLVLISFSLQSRSHFLIDSLLARHLLLLCFPCEEVHLGLATVSVVLRTDSALHQFWDAIVNLFCSVFFVALRLPPGSDEVTDIEHLSWEILREELQDNFEVIPVGFLIPSVAKLLLDVPLLLRVSFQQAADLSELLTQAGPVIQLRDALQEEILHLLLRALAGMNATIPKGFELFLTDAGFVVRVINEFGEEIRVFNPAIEGVLYFLLGELSIPVAVKLLEKVRQTLLNMVGEQNSGHSSY